MGSMLIFAFISLLNNAGINKVGKWLSLLGSTLQTIPPVTLVPRFILNLREFYVRDLQGRRGSSIDTAFGFGSGLEQSAIQSTIEFADGGQNESEEQGNEMEMEIQEVDRTRSLA